MKDNSEKKLIIKVGHSLPLRTSVREMVSSSEFKKLVVYHEMLNEIEELEDKLRSNCSEEKNKTKKRVKDIDKN